MKKHIILYILSALLLASCSEDIIVNNNNRGNKEVCTLLEFSHNSFDVIATTTRATLGVVPESRVQNLFIYLFDKDGKCVYTQYFDNNNKLHSEEALQAATWNCWYVNNLSKESEKTNGKIRMRTKDITDANIYIIANIDADMVNISPEKLNTIHSEDEIKQLTATLNQEITSRNGYFPMAAKLEGVSIEDNTVKSGSDNAIAELYRLDAKIAVNVRVAENNKITSNKTVNGATVTTTQVLKSFIPDSWRVVNLPKGAYVMPGTEDCEQAGYFSTEDVGFEKTEEQTFKYKNQNNEEVEVTSNVHSFSFYMLQNKETKKKDVEGNYHLRDKRNKNSNGKYDNSQGMWEYAPENGTYIEIKGQVEMEVDVSSEAKGQHLAADVTYYVHLGDFGNDKNDYNILRNTIYTYTITIKGVDNIEVEVSKDVENESGATGDIYIANEEIITYDAHYAQQVYSLDAANIDPDKVTWYVKTPFCEGVPKIVGGTEIPSGLDYKWVEFLVNDVDSETGSYSKLNQKYPGFKNRTGESENLKLGDKGHLMNVVELTTLMKSEVRKHQNGQESIFKKEFDQEWFDWYQVNHPDETIDKDDKTKVWWRSRVYLTVFVDEYYYTEDPITKDKRQGLWKEFVNQPNRVMHILCDNKKSLDGESSTTGSIITIRQRSIQTPYNMNNTGLTDGWGCETIDETEGKGFYFFNTNESMTESSFENIPTQNNSEFNGRYNTAVLWGVLDDEKEWDEYLNFNRVNNYVNDNGIMTYFLKDYYAVLRYAPLLRNRDNNGNGIIDKDEVRWYIASIDQLYGLYLGQLGLSSDAILYSIDNSTQKGTYPTDHPYAGAHKWRKHIVSSTNTNGGGKPVTLWAEEGISVSNYTERHSKPAPYSIRCIRNLGMDDDIIDKEIIPTKLVNTIPPTTIEPEAEYKFDLTNINDKSLRFFTTRELEPDNEHSEMSRPYRGFRTGKIVTTGKYEGALYNMLIDGESPCDEYWRVPNMREGAIMSLYCDSKWWDGNTITVSSFYSNGKKNWGNGNDNQPSWQFKYRYATIGTPDANVTFSVQDWDPNE